MNRNIGTLKLEGGSKWSLASMRQEVIIALDYNAQEDFDIYIVEGNTHEKVISNLQQI